MPPRGKTASGSWRCQGCRSESALSAGIITKEYGMWKLREDLQDKGIAVYVTGRMRCFYHFYLSWTPKGIEFIKEIINNRTRH